MNNLMKGPIKNFALGIYDGPHATPPESSEGPIFLGIKNVTPEGRLDFSEIKHISEEYFPKWTKRVTPRADDIVFSYEATLHRYALIPEGFQGCLGRRMGLVRPDKLKVIPKFLHYYFLSSEWRSVVESNIISGATVDRIPIKKFPDFEVEIPTLETQKRIVDILSPYDELIEKNNRKISLLELSARLLYKEWFVKFRFPGHSEVKITDGVPEGWKRLKIKDFVKLLGGFAFKSKTYQNSGKYGIVTIKNVHDAKFIPECNSFINEIPRGVKEHSHLKTGDILMSLTGNVGRVCIVYGDNYLLNQRVAKLEPLDEIPKTYIYWTFNNEIMQKGIENLSSGAAQQNLSPIKLSNQDFILPSSRLLNLYNNYTEDIFNTICNLNITNQKLMKTRDILLPRLMKGEISV